MIYCFAIILIDVIYSIFRKSVQFLFISKEPSRQNVSPFSDPLVHRSNKLVLITYKKAIKSKTKFYLLTKINQHENSLYICYSYHLSAGKNKTIQLNVKRHSRNQTFYSWSYQGYNQLYINKRGNMTV